MNEELKQYVQNELANGISKDAIRATLKTQGDWTDEDIDQIFSELTPTPAPPPTKSPATVTPEEKHTMDNTFIAMLGVVLVLLLVIGGFAYAYVAGIGPFQKAGLPYLEDNLVSGIAASLSNLETFTYSMAGKFEVEDRDADARPFALEMTGEMMKFREQYARDHDRFSAVQSILSQLRYSEIMPTTLDEVATMDNPYSSYYNYGGFNYVDPFTGEQYIYRSTGDDFELQVTFETNDAINAVLDSYSFDEADTYVNMASKTIVFSKNSSHYFYFPSEPPKPYFEELNEMTVYLPPELYFEAAITAASDFRQEDPDWEIALDVEGDFGDLIYRVAGDAKQVDKDLFFRIRNMPSLFAGFFAFEKGNWIRIPEKWIEENKGYGSFMIPTYLIPDEEDEVEYKKDREELGKFMTTAIKIADEENVLQVVNTPRKEEKNEKQLYRYDLVLNKERMVPFFERLVEESQKYEITRDWDLVSDNSFLEYLKSAEFDAVFDYYNQNASHTLWVNQDGFIEWAEYSLRIVPSDSATVLAGKQARLTLSFGFDDINKPVKIEAPREYEEIDVLVEEMESTLGRDLYEARTSGSNASVKQSLSSLRSQAEIVYNRNGDYSYGSVCDDSYVRQLLVSAEVTAGGSESEIVYNADAVAGHASCVDGDDWYAVQAPLLSNDDANVVYWCVDSNGYVGSSNNLLRVADEGCPDAS